MISKELLSVVLDKDITSVSIVRFSYLIYFVNRQQVNINIHELAFLTRDFLKTKSKHLTLDQDIKDIFNEANSIYKSLSNK